MKKILFRVCSYVLDLLLVSLIILGLSMISFINPINKKLEGQYEVYNRRVNEIQQLSKNLDNYLEDSMISSSEYDDIVNLYPSFVYVFDKYELNEDLKNKDIEKMKDEIDKKSSNLVNETGIYINKLKTPQIIISLVVYVLYFGVLQYFMNGQTVFKRIFRLKVVNNKNKSIKIPLWNYLVRALLVSEIILSLIDSLFVFILGSNSYVVASYWIDNFKYLYEMAFLVAMVIRDDQRSIHDLLLNTRVVRYDKDNNEIIDKLFDDEDDKNEVSTLNKKEFVKAEKVND